MISAPDKAALLHKLEVGDYSNTGGDYRLVVFDPTENRLSKAVTIVELDKPWHGRMDIWFSRQQLLAKGGKLVFMFPGINIDQTLEFESLADGFALPSFDEFLAYLGMQVDETTSDDAIHSLQVFFGEWLSREALKVLGFEADMYVGHSIGEWTASDLAGITDGVYSVLAKAEGTFENQNEYPMVAVSGMATETMESWCEDIGDLYLSNDNCPGQMLLSGTPEAIEVLVARLEEEQYFYTVLPYSYGYHTPLITGKAKSLAQFLGEVSVTAGSVPVWSATTLEPVPTERAPYLELVEGQLTRPVYFRGLIEKLYEEQNARIFVQIGRGSLSGFVEDTLKDRSFGAVSCNSATRSSADQLRRVLALFFVEGRAVDPDFMGVKRLYQVEHNLMVLPKGAPLLTELPELREALAPLLGVSALSDSSLLETEISSKGDPLLQAVSQNLREAAKSQKQLLEAFREGRPAGTDSSVSPQGAAQPVKPVSPVSFEEPLCLSFEDHPYLIDHAIVRQPANWEHGEDLNPVVPFTMTIELLAEIAKKRLPDKKLLSIEKVMAYQWIAVETPFEGTVKGRWKAPDILELELIGFAKAEFHFGDEWSLPPLEYEDEIDLGEIIISGISAEELYDNYAFHGPQYQSSILADNVYERGMKSTARKQTGKGSLLDIMGQQLGLFLHMTETSNTISFPVRLKKLSFFADIFDQGGEFDHTLIITRLDDHAIVGTMVLKRNGKIWAVAHDFVGQRFENDIQLWNVLLKPQYTTLAQEIAPGVYHFTSPARNNILAMLEKRYLNYLDKKEYAALATPESKRRYLFSRIALKDAVRNHVSQDRTEMLYPIEIFCTHDENGQPQIFGEGETDRLLKGLHVSLAHKGNDAIALVGTAAVGVDLEKIEEKSEGFIALSYTEAERALLGSNPSAELVIRFWVAKEACAKKAGTGLRGAPKQFEVTALDGETLILGNEKVQTTLLGEEYVAGWTL
jgi:malonyl CoA-acyl carrier protein transacylase/phosphopantetheinyl transferase